MQRALREYADLKKAIAEFDAGGGKPKDHAVKRLAAVAACQARHGREGVSAAKASQPGRPEGGLPGGAAEGLPRRHARTT